MRAIRLPDHDHERVTLLARAWEISEGEVVRRLLDRFVQPPSLATTGDASATDTIAIYADYEGRHIEAIFHRATKRVDITDGVLAGRSFKSPSGAAIGVVQALNPNVHPNRNGWSFWFLKASGEALQNIRHE